MAAVKKKKGKPDPAEEPDAVGPRPDDPYQIVYFKRDLEGGASPSVPGHEFLGSAPPAVEARMRAVVMAVAKAPPHKFAGGGKWEAMHGEMGGIYEIRVDGPPNRTHYRLFCVLDTQARGRGPLLVILDGAAKPFRTEMSPKVYARVRGYRDEYFSSPTRSVV